jgi:hypothetical protein
MEIQKKFFPKILPENEEVYFSSLFGVIDSVDELCSLQVIKNKTSYDFRLAPSLPKYNNMLIEEILKFHNMLQIKLELSKSIKSSGTIVFKLNILKI